jgi:glucose-6-phosphate 1-dehydrogenase
MTLPRSDALVFFGATGDLAFKQIFPALQALTKRGRLDLPIVTVGRKEMPIEQVRSRARESLEKSGDLDKEAFAKLAGRMSYVAVDYDDAGSFSKIREALGGAKHPLHYVALPPEVYESVASNLGKVGLAEGARLALEKPFGQDTPSARALSRSIHRYFPEESLFRIDHYLGKEAVENIVYFRASNPLIDASLSHEHVASVQITMAESFGVKGRGAFYDAVGAIRDVIQNHLLEVIACLTMDLPTTPGHGAVREARSALLARIQALSPDDVVRGQALGYKDEEGVARDSTTETFAAVRLGIDHPRWKDVPFFIRAGKSLPVTSTELLVRWKTSGQPVLEDRSPPAPNHLRFRIGPDTAIAVGVNVKKGGESMAGECREMVMHRAEPDALKPYERLLGDALDGDATLFARQDAVEESWRVVDPAVGQATPVHPYKPGTWGPAEATRLAPPGGWFNPA